MQLIENYISYELQNPQAADDTIDGIVEEAENLGLGNRNYEIIDIDNKGNV